MKPVVNALGKLNCGKWAYGVFVLRAMTAIVLAAQTPAYALTFTTLHSFDGTDGGQPFAGLVQATNGNLYGTTAGGGANGNGTVFEITPSGTLTTLHSFHRTDGSTPTGALVQATTGRGDFYGTGSTPAQLMVVAAERFSRSPHVAS
jgi:uncharacterized repeat protein (TIGR03803 family)